MIVDIPYWFLAGIVTASLCLNAILFYSKLKEKKIISSAVELLMSKAMTHSEINEYIRRNVVWIMNNDKLIADHYARFVMNKENNVTTKK